MPQITQIIDDKSEHCIPFILERIQARQEQHKRAGEDPPPFFIGLNGVQGAGKTTLVETLCSLLTSEQLNLPTVVLSIDDLYLPHDKQVQLAQSHADNPLVQHRGQPSTHDVQLGVELFAALRNRKSNIQVPSYDKSAFSGQGDRRNPQDWHTVNANGSKPVEVVIFEGWCVGFRPLTDAELVQTWKAAKEEAQRLGTSYKGQLGHIKFEHVQFVNNALKQYDQLTDQLDALIHIDAEDTQYVYTWRAQQETALRAAKGTGMTNEQVVHFVNGYYPAYELYSNKLRQGVYSEKGRQIRLMVDFDRRVKEVFKL
ncbi:hypothetical protein B9Z65_8297 [Elsinoe australis]|uniref:Uridine/cytidine kinase n=1 Tax=Elsinoe australis TaxID=40998 RepID=A0A2P7YDC3_9PEZI|nr:hypothetical protein B9Z65_8297 [Elsinoe australis]